MSLRQLWSIKAAASSLCLFGLLLIMLVFSTPAKADCSVRAGSVTLDPVSSLAIAENTSSAIGSAGFQCTGAALSLVSENWITARIDGGLHNNMSNARMKHETANDYIGYSLCKDISCNNKYNVGDQIEWRTTTFLDILALLTRPGGQMPIYVQTHLSGHLRPGVYRDSLNTYWAWRLCTLGIFNVCSYDTGSVNSQMQIQITITPDCVIDAQPVTFGTRAFVASFDAVTQFINIRCSKDQAYNVGISNGANYSGGSRRMTRAGEYIAYDIFYPVGSASRWGPLDEAARTSAQATINPGLYTADVDQSFQFEARIIPGQQTPSPGIYNDTLLVSVEF